MLRPIEVAKRLNVCLRTVSRWIASGQMRALRVGRVLRIAEDEIERFKRDHTY